MTSSKGSSLDSILTRNALWPSDQKAAYHPKVVGLNPASGSCIFHYEQRSWNSDQWAKRWLGQLNNPQMESSWKILKIGNFWCWQTGNLPGLRPVLSGWGIWHIVVWLHSSLLFWRSQWSAFHLLILLFLLGCFTTHRCCSGNWPWNWKYDSQTSWKGKKGLLLFITVLDNFMHQFVHGSVSGLLPVVICVMLLM